MERKFGKVRWMSDKFYDVWACNCCSAGNKHVRFLESKFDNIIATIYGGDLELFCRKMSDVLENTQFMGLNPSATMDIAVYCINRILNSYFNEVLHKSDIASYAGNKNYAAPIVKVEWESVEEDYYYNTETEYHITYSICDIAENMNDHMKGILRKNVIDMEAGELFELAEWKKEYDKFIDAVEKTMTSIEIPLKQSK